MKTNPNGANQYKLDPRQKLAWDYYIDPTSETFANATQSGIKAGFTPEYSNDLTSAQWFCDKLWVLNSVSESEKVFKETLEASHTDIETGKIDVGLLRIKTDIAKFLASTKGKEEGYSTRQEQTGKDGKDLIPETYTSEEKQSLLNLLKK